MFEEFETEPEHAAWLGVHIRTLRRYRDDPAGGLPYTKRGKTILHKREWTLEWLDGRKTSNNMPRRGRRAA